MTVTNKVFLMDSLCHTFNLILPQHTDTAMRKKVLKMRPTRSIGMPASQEHQPAELIPFKIKGTNASINLIGLPTITLQKYVVMQA